MTNHSQWKTILHQKIKLSTQIHNDTEKMVYPSLVALMLMSHDQYGMSFCMRITFFYSSLVSLLFWCWCLSKWCRSFTDMASPQLHHIPVRYETINDDKKVSTRSMRRGNRIGGNIIWYEMGRKINVILAKTNVLHYHA